MFYEFTLPPIVQWFSIIFQYWVLTMWKVLCKYIIIIPFPGNYSNVRLIGEENFGEKECLELEGNLVQIVHSFLNSTHVYCILTVAGHQT